MVPTANRDQLAEAIYRTWLLAATLIISTYHSIMKFFEPGLYFHEVSRTFHGKISWAFKRRKLRMECSPCVSSRLRFLAFWSDSHATQMEWRTLPAEHTTEQRQLCRFPLDGKWTKSWDTVCYYNIAAMGFKDKAKSIQGRFADLSRLHHEKFDAVLCNPPYIPDVGGRRKLDVATTAFEPRKALFVNREAPNIHYEHV